TGLMERLVAEIAARGFSVSTIKHAHHTFDIDHAGKDSHRHRVAGAGEVLLASRHRWALMHEVGEGNEPDLSTLLELLTPCDLVLIEGYKRDTHQKIETSLAVSGQDLIAREDETVVALASDKTFPSMDITQFDLQDTPKIADFVLQKTGLNVVKKDECR
ncbi:MAG: molybdopterin-guanine dinucleotide biosynthesis protein B, partial [Devosiaceae bacterium]|nr:molybdopterin-guanine dinucleotide biosynthesis protein B [Devosiaceae bacterium]